ncbi:DUF2141 domain-containing protein [Mitsuaria sp. GD03876]|uniref:DUF2141 domain-containing protein n=1 Tax=Mitsuaria sp. GD03876 TaxID=2975399 RepID=UPI0024477950|nr:DUF2141 domain-containing protein [Mitsuaria sp. GD03876]MDH0868200.1 DUF2141 domain-containing protein [Mitsuaria sp. GD03876]
MSIRSSRPSPRPSRLAAAPALAGLVLLLGAPLARAADLEVEVSGLAAAGAASGGQVMAAAFGPDGWLKQPVATARAALAQSRDGVVTLRLTGLPDGPVAVSVFQDMNGNGKLDRNPMGMPTEPYAFSRQAQGQFGPPSFEQAVLPAGTTRHAIRLSPQP